MNPAKSELGQKIVDWGRSLQIDERSLPDIARLALAQASYLIGAAAAACDHAEFRGSTCPACAEGDCECCIHCIAYSIHYGIQFECECCDTCVEAGVTCHHCSCGSPQATTQRCWECCVAEGEEE